MHPVPLALILCGCFLLTTGGVIFAGLPDLAVEITYVPPSVMTGQNCRVDFRDTCSAAGYHTHTYRVYVDGEKVDEYTSSYIWWDGEQIWRNLTAYFTAPYSPGTHTVEVRVSCHEKGYATVSDSRTFEVFGRPEMVHLEVRIAPQGAGAVSPGSGDYVKGSTVTLQAVPNPGSEFDCWYYHPPGTTSAENPITLKLNYDTYVEARFKVTNNPPVADFSATVSGLTAVFADNSYDSDGRIERVEWDFGDGARESYQRPIPAEVTHTYASSDNYTVTYTVYDDLGARGEKRMTVEVLTPRQVDEMRKGGERVAPTADMRLWWPGVLLVLAGFALIPVFGRRG